MMDNPTALIVAICISIVAIVDVTKRKLQAPAKPLITCILDTLLFIPYYLEIGPWGEPNDINTAIVKAIKATGLKDVGSPDDCMFMTRYNTARKVGLRNSNGI